MGPSDGLSPMGGSCGTTDRGFAGLKGSWDTVVFCVPSRVVRSGRAVADVVRAEGVFGGVESLVVLLESGAHGVTMNVPDCADKLFEQSDDAKRLLGAPVLGHGERLHESIPREA